ncbi:MAG: GTPase domain-containing protein [Deltaproteobacteria bacterium]|nr:GTPase domain-containing protein [Deltaproteobacteria bacterium]
MAVIDRDAGEIVIRVVYDGPPEAGKTTSVRALAGSLAQPSYTPVEDADGRTLWFDWMEYVGGRFEGCRIRCQIVSVPGQRELGERRRRLLAAADVVVFVGDSTAAGYPRTLDYLFELRALVASAPGAPVGVVLQANKRDRPDAVPIDELRAQLGLAGWSIGVLEAVAADGTGIREAFVYAVRLALDRVREQLTRGELATGGARLAGADELLATLRAGERDLPRARHRAAVIESGPGSVAAELLREVLACEDDGAAPARPTRGAGEVRPPDAGVPSGAIWPPVEGRAILCELDGVALHPRRLSTGDWAAGLGAGWRVVSTRDARFASLDQGRAALIPWARLHAACASAISARRCIVLADDGDGGWRLWQIVRAEPSLREVVEDALREATGEAMLWRVCQAAQLLLDADHTLARAPLSLPCNLDTIGPSDASAVYIGLMPDATASRVGAEPPRDPRALLASQLAPLLTPDLGDRGAALGAVLARLPSTFTHAETIVPAIAAILAADPGRWPARSD